MVQRFDGTWHGRALGGGATEQDLHDCVQLQLVLLVLVPAATGCEDRTHCDSRKSNPVFLYHVAKLFSKSLQGGAGSNPAAPTDVRCNGTWHGSAGWRCDRVPAATGCEDRAYCDSRNGNLLFLNHVAKLLSKSLQGGAGSNLAAPPHRRCSSIENGSAARFYGADTLWTPAAKDKDLENAQGAVSNLVGKFPWVGCRRLNTCCKGGRVQAARMLALCLLRE